MNCDPIAAWYQWVERAVFWRTLDRARREFVSAGAKARHSLLLGDGDGRFLEALLQVQDEADGTEIDTLDLSAGMLAEAQSRAPLVNRVRYLQADARDFNFPAQHYDLIATHFFFDCFSKEELAALIPRIAQAAGPNAVWLVTEFRVPRDDWSAPLARGLIAIMYLFFKAVTGLKTQQLADHRPILAANGFHIDQAVRRWRGWIVSERWISER